MYSQNDVFNYLKERGNSDESFRASLTSNPQETIRKSVKEQFNIDVPDDIKFNVVVDKEDAYTLVLRPFEGENAAVEAY